MKPKLHLVKRQDLYLGIGSCASEIKPLRTATQQLINATRLGEEAMMTHLKDNCWVNSNNTQR